MVLLKRKTRTFPNMRKPTARVLAAALLVLSLVIAHVSLNTGDAYGYYNEASSLLTQTFGGDNKTFSSERVEAHLRHGATFGLNAQQPQSNERDEQHDKVSDESPIHHKDKDNQEMKKDENHVETKQQKEETAHDTPAKKANTDEIRQDSDAKEDNDGEFTVSSAFISYLQSLDPIPRKVHIFFPDKEFENQPDPQPIVQHGILRLKKLNPNWHVTVYDDSDIDMIINDATDILSKEERDILLGQPDGKGGWTGGAHIVEKTDLVRLILMYTQGGLYMDVDRVVNVKLDDLFAEKTRMCLPTFNDVNFMQDLMCSSANNKLYLETIKAQSQRRLTGGRGGGPLERRGGWATADALFGMGPPSYNKVISRLVFDKDNIISKDDIPKARLAVEATHGVIVTKRDEWCNGFLVTPYEGCKQVNRNVLYSKYGLTGWKDAVTARWSEKAK